MALSLTVRMAIQGKLSDYDRAVAVANTLAIRTATHRMKNQGRRQMERAGLGRRLPTALGETVIGSGGQDITKRGIDPNPVGIVQSRAFVKGRPGGMVDLIEVFETGTVVVPRQGSFLAVPTRLAGGRRAKPMGDYPEGTFRLVPVRGGGRGPNAPHFLAIHKARREVWYLLIRAVKLRKRLNLAGLHSQIAATVPALLEQSWQRELAKLEARF